MEFLKEEVESDYEELVNEFSNSSSPVVVDENPLELCDQKTGMTQNKCGEIYTSDYENFTYLCTFCSTLLEDIDKFISHVSTHHTNEAGKTDKIEDPLKPSDSYYEDSSIKLEPHIQIELADDAEMLLAHLNEISNNFANVSRYEIENDERDLKDLDTKIDVTTLSSCKPKDLMNFEEKTNCDADLHLDQPKKKKKKRKPKNRVILLCDLCNKEFLSEKTFRVHKKYDHIPTNPFFQLSSIENQSNVPIGDSDDEKMQGSEEVIQTFTQLIENDPLKCRYCGRRFGNRKIRFEHECSHTGENPYSCEICGKSFRRSDSYRNHLKVHTNEKPYKCEICNATFREKVNLNVHIRRHLGEKRFKCDFCDKTFVQSTGKKQHERIHTGERPFQCIQCGMCFQTSSKLGVHTRKHLGIRPYKCNDCDKSFFTKQELTTHAVKHTGDRPYACGVCKATFPRKKTLKTHEKIHLDIEGYVCKICGKGFKAYQGLYCHMKSHGDKLNSS